MIMLGLFDSLLQSSVGQDINLLILGFKLVILLYIIQFFKGRFGDSPIMTLLVAGVAYLFLFTNYFAVFGPMMFIYLFVAFGFTSILFDLAIAKPWKEHDFGKGGEGNHTTYKEEVERSQAIRAKM